MITRFRFFLALALFAFPVALAAQPVNEVAAWVSTARFDDTRLEDENQVELELRFEENVGYGVSFTRYWTANVATELSAHKLSADTIFRVSGPGLPTIEVDGGDLDLTAYGATVQWHFQRANRISPYVGAGVAYVTGELAVDDFEQPEQLTTELESEFTWLANAGVNFGLTRNLALGVDAKYIAYEPKAEGDPDSERGDLNPLVVSAGLRLRF